MESFIRLATESVNRLVADPILAAELHDSMSEATSSTIDRLMAAQLVLARVLSYEQATLGEPLTAEDLEVLLRHRDREPRDRSEPLKIEVATRLVYELTLSGGRSWPALEDLEARRRETVNPDDDVASSDPLVGALHVLVGGAGGLLPRYSYAVRLAAEQARAAPLGFCRLVLEVADAADENHSGDTSQLARAGVQFDDPFLRREAQREWFDLRALAAVYLADRARREGRLAACDAQLASLPELLEAGTGDADLKARVEEVHAGRELASGDRTAARRALRRLRRAGEILQDEPVDRPDHLVEVRLKQALVLAVDPATRQRAADALNALAESFGPARNEVHRDERVDPGLRLRAFLAAARVELDLARQKVAEDRPLGAVGGPRAVEGLAAYAEAWSEQAHHLVQAGTWLDAAEPLLEVYGRPRQRAEHRWYLGQSLLLEDRGSAARHLRRALADFREIGDRASADRVSIDLIVCGVLAGALGDEVDDWSEPLRLFQQLAART